MKKILIVTLAVFMVSSMAMAGTIQNTRHDFSSSGTNTTYRASNTDEICVHCHTPHVKSGAATIPYTPLWNRAANNNTQFYPFTSATLSAGNQKASPFVLSTVSLACLTCHDGSLANSGTAGGPITNRTVSAISYATGTLVNGNFGTILTGVHPIAVSLATASAASPAAYFATSQDTSNVVLYNGQVECASCHNPHINTTQPFLVKANSTSAICAACHRY